MAEIVKFTKSEIENAKDVFKKLSIQFEENNELFLDFKSRPIRFLRQSGLIIMKYVNNESDRKTIMRFYGSLYFFLLSKNVFDRCSWCKVTALTIIYALCGKARLSIDGCWGIISSIIEAIENILNMSNDVARALVRYLNSLNERLSPFRLASHICQHLGYCP